MEIQDFDNLMELCCINVNEEQKVVITPKCIEDQKSVRDLIKNNHLENLSMSEFCELAQKHHSAYLVRKKLKQQKLEKYSALSPQQTAELPIEQKLEYIELLYPRDQKLDEFMKVTRDNEQNIRSCLFHMDFPKSFWDDEKNKADRYASLVANSPEITDKMRAWSETSLDEKKEVVKQSAKIFEYVYGVAPEIVFFTPEEEKAKQRAQGLNENAHINAAYYQHGKLHFNEERLQTGDNFFAVSVLFHEGTHYRQYTENFNDPLVERILNGRANVVTVYENEVSQKGDANYKDLYTMLPSEVHAHGVQEYMENKLTEMTGIDKIATIAPDKDVKSIHNKAFSMAKLSQCRAKIK